jgi:hypothetical protein
LIKKKSHEPTHPTDTLTVAQLLLEYMAQWIYTRACVPHALLIERAGCAPPTPRGGALWAYPDAHALGSKTVFSNTFELKRRHQGGRNSTREGCKLEHASRYFFSLAPALPTPTLTGGLITHLASSTPRALYFCRA